MNIWLDDERDPTDPYIQNHFGAEATDKWVKTAEEAIVLLEKGEIELISFDHDLGEGKTGYDVAKWIESNAYYNNIKRIEWFIHSANPVGTRNIETTMNRADEFWSINEQKE